MYPDFDLRYITRFDEGPFRSVLASAASYPSSSTTMSYVPRGRFRTLKWPSKSVKTLRNTPAARDFRLTATWVAGRLSASRSTVPEISPSVFSKLDTCALALGVQTMGRRFRKKLSTRSGRSLVRWQNVSTVDTSSCISTYGAPLRGASGDLAVAGD